MLFWSALLMLVGLFGMGVAGAVLVMRISEALADVDAETWQR